MALSRNWRQKVQPDKIAIAKASLALSSFHKNNNLPSLSRFKYDQFMQTLNTHHIQLNKHLPCKHNTPFQITLTAYEETYLCMEIGNLLFPLTICMQQMKGRATMYVGYDNPYPGICHQNKNNSKRHTTQIEQLKNYEYKFTIIEQCSKVITKNIHDQVKTLFISITALSQILSFQLLVREFQPNIKQPQPKLVTMNHKKIKSFTRSNISASLPKLRSSNRSPFKSKHQQFMQTAKNQSNQVYDHRFPHKVFIQTVKHQKPINFVQLNQSFLENFGRSKTQSFNILRKQKNRQSLIRVRANVMKIDEYHEKQYLLREKATSCKKLIEYCQENFKRKQQMKEKYHKLFTTVLFLSIACHKMSRAHQAYQQHIRETFSVGWVTKKFSNKMLSNYRKVVEIIPYFKKRNLMGTFHTIQFTSKYMNQKKKEDSVNIINQLLFHLKPALQLNHAFNRASKFKKAIRLIEQRWLLRHRNRMKMLIMFSRQHIIKMFKEHPHLKMFESKFQAENQCEKIVFQYICDQTHKYSYLKKQYRQKCEEIQKIKEINIKIRQQNMNKPAYKRKKQITVNKKVYYPQNRVFRNIDILKTMLRAYFQLQYKKKMKKKINNY